MSNVLTDVRHFVPRFQLDLGQHYEVIAVEIVSRKDYSVNVLNREACAYYVLLFYSILQSNARRQYRSYQQK